LASIEQFTKAFTDNYNPASRAAVVTLPVVVHVDTLEQEVQQSQEHSAQLMQSCLREVFN